MPANPEFDDLVTSTLRNRTGKAADNATRTIAGLNRMKAKGKVKPFDGGRTIVQELETGLNPNAGWYAGLDILSTALFQPFSAAEYDPKQAYVPVVWSGRDKNLNKGKSQVMNLITGRIANGEKSLVDLVAQAFYSDGTGFGGKQLGGLGLMVVVAPATGTVGGIDRAANPFWRNKTGTVDFVTGANIVNENPTDFLKAMNALAIAVTRGTDRADLWLADSVGYTRYLESLQPIQRISNVEMGGAGFTNLKYYGVGGDSDFVLDNGYCPASTVFALNTDYIFLRPHEDVNFVSLGGERMPVNQDATIRQFGFMGNLTSSGLQFQGRLSQE